MIYKDWLESAILRLSRNRDTDPFIDPKIDAMLLLEFVTNCSRASILAFPETILDDDKLATLNILLERRINGEPIAYILGSQPFWRLDLLTTPDTLIPRNDTEVLVEIALDYIQQRIVSTDFGGELTILDLGTGTGAIALALSQELRSRFQNLLKYSVIGVDLVANAVKLAENNAIRNNIENVFFYQSNWFDNLGKQYFDIIVSNPPYIDKTDPHLQYGDVRFEPISALVAEEQGYADLRYIITKAPAYLKPKGGLLLEHGWQQGNKVRSFFQKDCWQQVSTLRDYSHNERVTLAQLK